jgi:hypothetical protein
LNTIYRNGKHENDSTQKILVANIGVFGISIAIGIFMMIYSLQYTYAMEGNMFLTGILTVTFFCAISTPIYLYLTFLRLRPLAEFEENSLIINASFFSKRKIDLSKVESIRLQHSSEFDQRMRVKYKGETYFEFTIKQTHCSVEQFSAFINQACRVKVTYS